MASKLALLLLCLPGAVAAQSAPVAQSAAPPAVAEMPLDAPNPAAAGLLPARVTGLPGSLWLGSEPQTLAALTGAVDAALPAINELMRTLMLAEATPPSQGAEAIDHLARRIDWLRGRGAVEEALALLDIAGIEDPRLFLRWADLNLLLGQSEPVCRMLEARPGLSTDLSLRVFCTARGGDWARAELILGTGRALGEIPARRAELLARFLDPELAEGEPALIPPVRPSALEFRLFEALGEPLPTAPLPLEFSVLDLSGDNGWRAQIEAAERLARAGSLPSNRLLGLYTLRRPAASGGVWDRVRAFQDFESAMSRGTPDLVEQTLEKLWPQMASARLLVPFGQLYAKQLSTLNLTGRAARMAQRAWFLSPFYEELAVVLDGSTDPEARFLTAIARGQKPEATAALPHADAVAQAFGGAPVPDVLRAQLDEGRLGEVILRAVALFASGAEGNGQDLVDALATFRAVGLEDVARRGALQLMILDAERARR
ncbi:hypothetical protein [Tropicibacter naphthalenivorans]|uniref:Uncharacterized protein n=1 Tax=Tropicibacter naphthalenivorans TaxID=441103 RepID=A0A0P1G5V1_9RHOB|nr:hypothetical protein [Tropicibacter naphthalenivorans]CUH77138.1 hypothetical protein TRN7648_01316 [Tropicibacter naphthalenivorans]SMC60466.1 hypothetical protein SAMN04488093_102302 [Tropicibacter naphthalenivorans]